MRVPDDACDFAAGDACGRDRADLREAVAPAPAGLFDLLPAVVVRAAAGFAVACAGADAAAFPDLADLAEPVPVRPRRDVLVRFAVDVFFATARLPAAFFAVPRPAARLAAALRAPFAGAAARPARAVAVRFTAVFFLPATAVVLLRADGFFTAAFLPAVPLAAAVRFAAVFRVVFLVALRAGEDVERFLLLRLTGLSAISDS